MISCQNALYNISMSYNNDDYMKKMCQKYRTVKLRHGVRNFCKNIPGQNGQKTGLIFKAPDSRGFFVFLDFHKFGNTARTINCRERSVNT